MIKEIKCPYCGFVNSIILEEKTHHPKCILTCDSDEGGCDKDFVAEFTTKITVDCKKIEGQ